jgi:hypothetical protein
MKVNIYNINDSHFLNIEQIIPLPSVADYQIKIREKTNQAVREASTRKRGENTIKILIAQGILQEGTRIYLMRSPNVDLDINSIEKQLNTPPLKKLPKNLSGTWMEMVTHQLVCVKQLAKNMKFA